MRWYIRGVRRYAVIDGRADRREFWMFTLVHGAILMGLLLGEQAVGIGGENGGVLANVYWFGSLFPWLATGARRLHDTGRSSWWLLIALLPLVGWLVLLNQLIEPGERGANRFGHPPDAVTGEVRPAAAEF